MKKLIGILLSGLGSIMDGIAFEAALLEALRDIARAVARQWLDPVVVDFRTRLLEKLDEKNAHVMMDVIDQIGELCRSATEVADEMFPATDAVDAPESSGEGP